jgi:hypothetical protein
MGGVYGPLREGKAEWPWGPVDWYVGQRGPARDVGDWMLIW